MLYIVMLKNPDKVSEVFWWTLLPKTNIRWAGSLSNYIRCRQALKEV